MIKEQYIRIYDYMINDLHLSSNTLLVYALIHSYTDANKECYMTQCSIARLLNIDRATVYRAIIKLLKKGLIEKHDNNDRIAYKATQTRTSNTYFDIFKSFMQKKLSGNELLVYAYLHKNIKSSIQDISNTLHLCAAAVGQITAKLDELGYMFKEHFRDAKGRFKRATFYLHKNICNTAKTNATAAPTDATHILINNTNKTNTKASQKNKWNNFHQNEYDFEVLEAAILAN